MTYERYNQIVDLIIEYGGKTLREGISLDRDAVEESQRAFSKVVQELVKEINWNEWNKENR